MMIVTVTRMSGICTFNEKKIISVHVAYPQIRFPILTHSFYVLWRLSPHNAKASFFFYIFKASANARNNSQLLSRDVSRCVQTLTTSRNMLGL